MKYYRVGVHVLVDLLYSPENVLSSRKTHSRTVEDGNIVHLRLGYVGSEAFKRYYRTGDYLIEVIGTPDKINTEEGCVEELKTYKTEKTKKMQKERGRLQLMFYSWLTGLNCAKLVLYDVSRNKIDVIKYSFKDEEIKKVVEKAVEKYVRIIE